MFNFKQKLILALTLLSLNAFTQPILMLTVDSSIENTSRMPFIERTAGLALNVEYDEIKRLRKEIVRHLKLGRPLRYLTSWEPEGEAHVTTITPPEYARLSSHIDLKTINAIARNLDIQGADLKVLGMGSGKKKFKNEQGETFFLIVKSRRLLKIRKAIFQEFVERGGRPEAFNPDRFFPHITIGYTHADIHEPDIEKSLVRSRDTRFKIRIKDNL